MSRPNQQFVAFAGLRGVAALVVLQWHGMDFLGGMVLPSGYLAVDFFFLLSGWVLASAYDRRLDDGMSGLEFMRLRMLRLYPAYIFAVAMVLGGWAIGGHSIAPGPVFALLFLPDFFAPTIDWVVRPSWSLLAEVVVNTPFGFLHRRLTTPVLAGTIAVAFLGLAVMAAQWGSLNVGHDIANWEGLFARVFYSFPLGVLLYRYREKLTAWAPRWATWPSYLALVALFAIPVGPQLKGLLDLVIVCAALPLLLLFASRAAPRSPTTAIATTLGVISYPLYLINMPVMKGIDVALQAFDLSIHTIPILPGLGVAAGITLLAWLIARGFEEPVRNWLARLRWRPATTQPLGVLKSSKQS